MVNGTYVLDDEATKRPTFLRSLEDKPVVLEKHPQKRAASGLDVSQENRIKAYVAEYLFPYISGEITKETEDKTRKSFALRLIEKMKLSKKQDNRIKKFALHEYIKRSVRGAYIHFEIPSGVEIDPQINEPISILMNALEPALVRDFPGKKFVRQTLKGWVLDALMEVNDERRKKKDAKLRDVPDFSANKSKNLSPPIIPKPAPAPPTTAKQ